MDKICHACKQPVGSYPYFKERKAVKPRGCNHRWQNTGRVVCEECEERGVKTCIEYGEALHHG